VSYFLNSLRVTRTNVRRHSTTGSLYLVKPPLSQDHNKCRSVLNFSAFRTLFVAKSDKIIGIFWTVQNVSRPILPRPELMPGLRINSTTSFCLFVFKMPDRIAVASGPAPRPRSGKRDQRPLEDDLRIQDRNGARDASWDGHPAPRRRSARSVDIRAVSAGHVNCGPRSISAGQHGFADARRRPWPEPRLRAELDIATVLARPCRVRQPVQTPRRQPTCGHGCPVQSHSRSITAAHTFRALQRMVAIDKEPPRLDRRTARGAHCANPNR